MDIVFSANNFAEVCRLPILPSELAVESPWNNEEFETIGHGTLKLIGLKGLRQLTIDSFFPMRAYPFARDKKLGKYHIAFFEKWRARRVPMRVIITLNDGSEYLNMPCMIDSFTYGIDRAGDYPYSLAVSEFRFVKVT